MVEGVVPWGGSQRVRQCTGQSAEMSCADLDRRLQRYCMLERTSKQVNNVRQLNGSRNHTAKNLESAFLLPPQRPPAQIQRDSPPQVHHVVLSPSR